MIYLFDELEYINDSFLDKIIKVLPFERKNKAKSYKFSVDKKQSAIGYMLLLYGLKKEYGIFEELEFIYGKNGKPYLKNYPNIYFNISHCKLGVVCAISENEVGVDIEAVEDFDIETGKYIANIKELEIMLNGDNPDVEFYRIWTQKESILKLTGEGICNDLKNILEETDSVNILTMTNNEIKKNNCKSKKYIISICSWAK